MLQTINNEIKNSDSLTILKSITSKIKERSFHKYTHILYDLRTILGNNKKIYMEIGSYCGASASLILQHPFKTDVYCIDPLVLNKNHYKGNKSQEDTLINNLNNFKKNNTYKVFKNFSNDKKLLENIKNINIDILFIDGDHSYNAVINDFKNYEKYVNKNGFIVFDDYLDKEHSPQVKPAVDFIVSYIKKYNLPYEIIGSLPDYKNAGRHKMSNEFILYKKDF